MSQDAKATVVEFVNALVDGRLDDALGLLQDDFIVYEPGGLPFSGEYHGPQGFSELFAKITKDFELALNPAIQYFVGDDNVVMRGRMKFTARASGKSAEIGLVEISTVRNGRIVALDVYYKDPSAVAALLAA